jgi:carboxypeptidase C (cathepsin A)
MSDEQSKEEASKNDHLIEDQLVTTQHSVTINGRALDYTATAGTIVLQEEDDEGGIKQKAKIFFVAYTLDGVEEPQNRPLTFSFNGGPGSSSVWMHMGLLGPWRVDMGQDGHLPPPPYRLVENTYSFLDESDLVFIDPVSTGYSRPVEGEEAKQYHHFQKDIESIAEFIRLYTTRQQRWLSPKYLIGESYGTTRAAALSSLLQEKHGLYLNGIMLISSILNFQTAVFNPGNDLPYIFFLPTYAAIAWYHKQLDESLFDDLEQLLAEVQEFAGGEYAAALFQGSQLTRAEKAQIAQKIARYTGLSPAYIEQTNLRLEIMRFVKELLRDQRRTVGRLDGRFLGIDRDAAGENYEYDPSYANTQGPYTAGFNDYVRRQLNFKSDLPYEILTERVNPWSYETHQNQYINVAESLRQAMSSNPFLKVFVANGYYDLATPFAATQYTFSHLELEAELEENISMAYYEAGHMMYIHLPSLMQLKEDLANFVSASSHLTPDHLTPDHLIL